MQSLNVIYWKLTKVWLRKAAKFSWRLFFVFKQTGSPPPSRVGAMAPIPHMRWVQLNGGHKTPTLQPMRTPPPRGTDTNNVRLQMHCPSQITTRDGGEHNTHRKQKTKKKMTSLGPGSVVKVGAGGGKKRGQIGKISASEASPAMALSHPQTRRFFFFAHSNAEPGPRLKMRQEPYSLRAFRNGPLLQWERLQHKTNNFIRDAATANPLPFHPFKFSCPSS